MSAPNVHGRRFVMHMGWFFGVAAVLLMSNLLCTAPHLFSPVWYAVMWAALANVVRRMLLAFVAPCPWKQWRGWNTTANWLFGVCYRAGVRIERDAHGLHAILPGEE